MENTKVYEGQSLLDVSMQHTGSVENCFAIALQNGISLTDDLTSGNDLQTTGTANADIYNYYQSKQIKPATAITNLPGVPVEPEGIGYWVIGKNFKIS